MCLAARGQDCSTANISPSLAIVVLLLGAVFVYQLVRIADLCESDTEPHRQPRRRPAHRRPPADAPTADHLEALAEQTGRYQRTFAWMDPRTVTGKLTFAAWISRWWASGTFLRKVLLRELVKIVAVVSITAFIIVRYT